MNIKLALQWHIPDNWYGKNARVSLVPVKGEFFSTKTEAKKYLPTLKKYVKDPNNNFFSTKNKCIVLCEDEKDGCFETYRYCSCGPSWSCSERLLEVKDLEKYIKK